MSELESPALVLRDDEFGFTRNAVVKPRPNNMLWSVCSFILVVEACERLAFYTFSSMLVIFFLNGLGTTNTQATQSYESRSSQFEATIAISRIQTHTQHTVVYRLLELASRENAMVGCKIEASYPPCLGTAVSSREACPPGLVALALLNVRL